MVRLVSSTSNDETNSFLPSSSPQHEIRSFRVLIFDYLYQCRMLCRRACLTLLMAGMAGVGIEPVNSWYVESTTGPPLHKCWTYFLSSMQRCFLNLTYDRSKDRTRNPKYISTLTIPLDHCSISVECIFLSSMQSMWRSLLNRLTDNYKMYYLEYTVPTDKTLNK